MPAACARARIIARRIQMKREFILPQILVRTLRRFLWLAMRAFKRRISALARPVWRAS